MRLAFRVERIPSRAELVFGPLDAEWLVEQAAAHDIVVATDHDGPGADLARSAGVEVHVAPKRTTHAVNGPLSSDNSQATLLGDLHEAQPFDAVLDDSAMLVRTADLDRRFASVPGGVICGSEWGDLRLVTSDPVLFARYWNRVSAGAGHLTSADFCLASTHPASLGIRCSGLPPVVITAPSFKPQGDVMDPSGLLVVAATTLDRISLASVLTRVADAVPIDETTTIAVVHRDIPLQQARVRDLIAAGAPSGRELQSILVPAAQDGAAASLLAAADRVVLMASAESGVWAIRDAAATRPCAVVDVESSGEASAWPEIPPDVGAPSTTALIPFDGPAFAHRVREMWPEGADGAVVYTAEGAVDAARLAGVINWDRTDVAFVSRPEGMFGSPQPSVISPYVLGISGRVAASVARRARPDDALWDLVCAIAEPGVFEHLRTRLYPAVASHGHRDLPDGQPLDLAPWLTDTGILPRPVRIAPERVERIVEVSTPNPDGVKDWAQRHRWTDRARLILPWRWGMLPRAMRGRW